MSLIKTLTYLEKKHAIVNFNNEDNISFFRTVIAALFPKKAHPNRILQYEEHLNANKIDELTFPLPITSKNLKTSAPTYQSTY